MSEFAWYIYMKEVFISQNYDKQIYAAWKPTYTGQRDYQHKDQENTWEIRLHTVFYISISTESTLKIMGYIFFHIFR